MTGAKKTVQVVKFVTTAPKCALEHVRQILSHTQTLQQSSVSEAAPMERSLQTRPQESVQTTVHYFLRHMETTLQTDALPNVPFLTLLTTSLTCAFWTVRKMLITTRTIIQEHASKTVQKPWTGSVTQILILDHAWPNVLKAGMQ